MKLKVLAAAAATALVGLGLSGAPFAQTIQPYKLDPKTQIPAQRKPGSIRDGFTMAVTGDLAGPNMAVMDLQEPGFMQIVEILQRATLAVSNNETHILDFRTTKARPVAITTHPAKLPETAKEFVRMGFDVINVANNHAGDWGEEGVLESQKWLEDAGIATMGAGPNRSFAQAPRYVATRFGRVAFIGFTSTLNDPSQAPSDPVGFSPGRAGVSVLRMERDNSINVYDQYALLRNVRGAKEISDMVVIYAHSHPDPKYLQAFYHDAIDAGADLIVASDTVPDERGVEIYKGVPIIYGLEPFFYSMFEGSALTQYRYEAVDVDPRTATYSEIVRKQMGPWRGDTYFESAFIELKTSGGRVSEIKFYPLDLQKDATDYHNGYPRPADPKLGAKILGELQRVSAGYGATIAIKDNVGIIRIP